MTEVLRILVTLFYALVSLQSYQADVVTNLALIIYSTQYSRITFTVREKNLLPF